MDLYPQQGCKCPIKGRQPVEREALCLCNCVMTIREANITLILIGLIKRARVTAHSGMVILKAITVITHLS